MVGFLMVGLVIVGWCAELEPARMAHQHTIDRRSLFCDTFVLACAFKSLIWFR